MFLFYFILFFLDVLTCALLGDLETLCETYQCVSVGIVFDENVCALLCSVLWLEVETLHNARRVTVIGCQNGHVKVAVTDLTRGPSMIYLANFVVMETSRFTLRFASSVKFFPSISK